MSTGLTVASQTIGFISFGFTLLTWLGVYVSLFKTVRSAPSSIPLVLSNLRQEIQIERSALRERAKDADAYGVFPGRQMRRVGKNESYMKLRLTTVNNLWREFRDLENRFVVDGKGDDADLEGQGSEAEDSQFSDVDAKDGNYYDEKRGAAAARVREGRRAMRRRESHLRSRMGMVVGGLSTDRSMYYNTNMRHRILWWWKRDDVQGLQDQVQRLQLQRIEVDLFETDCLVKRGLAMLGGMCGDDPYENCGEGRRPSRGPTGGSGRRRKSHKGRRSVVNGRYSTPRSRNDSQVGVREVYEKEIRRTSRRSGSESTASRRRPSPPSPRAKVAGSTVSVGRSAETRSRSRAPSVVEYEIVNPGRIWVDVQDGPDNRSGRRSSINRPQPVHYTSYVRQRSSPDRGNQY